MKYRQVIPVFAALFATIAGGAEPTRLQPRHTVDSFRFYNTFRDAIHVRSGHDGPSGDAEFFRPVFGGAVMPNRGYHFFNGDDYAQFNENPFDWLSLAGNTRHPESALSILQDLYLGEAARRGQLDGEGARQARDVEKWLKPLQVTFFSGSEKVSRERLLRQYGNLPERAEKLPDSAFLRIQRASAWVITGTLFNGKALALPAERIAGFALDREAGWGLAAKPHLWELGRAAQTTPLAFRRALRMAIPQIYREAQASRLPGERALVVATAWDEAHARLYLSTGVMKEVGRQANGKALFAGRLEDLARALRIETADPALDRLKRQRPEWSYYQALSYLNEARDLKRGGFGILRMHDSTLLIESRDFSTHFNGETGSLSEYLYRHGIEDFYLPGGDAELRREIFDPLRDPFFHRPDDHHFDYGPARGQARRPLSRADFSWRGFLSRFNAVELLLDGQASSLHEAKVAAVQGMRLARARLGSLGFKDPAQVLQSSGVHFAVSTPHLELGQRLETLAADQDYVYSVETVMPASAFHNPTDFVPGGVRVGFNGVVFPVAQLLEFERDLLADGTLNPIEDSEARFIRWKLFGR